MKQTLMKKLLFILMILHISSGIIFAHEKDYNNLNQSTEETFDLKINDNINVNVTRSDNWIKTTNIFNNKNLEFQIEFHFDNEQLFYFRLINTQEDINKTFSVKRIKKNGYGYRNIKADFDLDFFFPREKNENLETIFDQFYNNPNFTDNDKLIHYSEELYRRIATYITEEIGTIDIFGEAVTDKKIDFLYYKYDNEKFSQVQKIKISNSIFDKESKKYYNKYHTEFTRKQLKNKLKIFFADNANDLSNTSLQNQNSIDLTALRSMMIKLILRNDFSINNDLFLNESIEQIITKKDNVKTEDKKFIGTYDVKLNNNPIEFELRENYQYYSKNGDEEKFGFWKLGERYNSKAIIVYNIYRINKKIGNITKPVDVGSSFGILMNDEKLMYPIMGSEAYTEAEKIK